MHRLKVMLALFLLAFGGISLASAAGVGTFSIEQTTTGVGVGQFGIATLYMDNTWQPPADSAILTLSWDPAVIKYVSADWKVGNSVAATPVGNNQIQLSFADYTNKYPGGRVPIADINFQGLTAGQSTMSIAITSVRSHVGISETEFTDLTASSLSNPGIFTVGQGGGTGVPTVPVGTTGTIAPTLTPIGTVTGTIAPTLTPIETVTGNVTGVPTVTGTALPTLTPIGTPTGITTGVPFVPVQGSTGGSEDYTGAGGVTRTATVTATTTGTATVTGTTTATTTATPGTGNGTVTMTVGTPGATGTAGVTATQTVFVTTPAGTTTARTTAPVNTTATRAGADVLPLAVAALAGLALVAVRRR